MGQPDEPSTSFHSFQRYIWEDFSSRRERNRDSSEKKKNEYEEAPEVVEEDKPHYVIGPGEIRQQLLAQTYYGKGEQTSNRQNLRPPKKPSKYPSIHAPTPREKQREQGFWPDEYAREDEILHIRSTYV